MARIFGVLSFHRMGNGKDKSLASYPKNSSGAILPLQKPKPLHGRASELSTDVILENIGSTPALSELLLKLLGGASPIWMIMAPHSDACLAAVLARLASITLSAES